MTLRTVTVVPRSTQPFPTDGLLTATYLIGRFKLTFNQRVSRHDGEIVEAVSQLQTWKPHTPIWDDLDQGERAAYRASRNAFAQQVADATGKDVVILESDEA